MSLNTREAEILHPTHVAAGEAAAHPAALEIPVLVNGARTIAGTDRREPFSENTQTVMVFGTGAVIKLASSVSIGQLLFLTNEQTKKEVVCQVVKSKTQATAAGYVELEFTEASPEFWGMRFAPNGHAAVTPAVPRPLEASAAPLLQSLQEKLTDVEPPEVKPILEPAALSVVVAEVAKPVATQIAEPATAKQESAPEQLPPAPAAKEIQPAVVVPAQPPVEAGKIPTLSEFLARVDNGTELRSRERSKAEPTEANEVKSPAASESAGPYKNGLTAALRSSLGKTEPATAKPENPAPGTYTFDFNAEEVKIPSWLEPLARNSGSVSAAKESPAVETKPSDKSHQENATHDGAEQNTTPSSATSEERADGASTLSGEGPVPNFGSGLALDARRSTDSSEGTSASNKGLLLTAAAVVLLLIAAGVWYWFSNQTAKASDRESEIVQPDSGAVTSPSGTIAAPPADRNTGVSARTSNGNQDSQLLNAAAARNYAAVPGKDLSAAPSGVSASSKSNDAEALPEAAAKKPAIGEIHLAAPKRAGVAHEVDTTEPEPAIGSNAIAGGDAGALLDNKTRQPVAPAAIPVGGDVKAARLLSSVPPVYPQMARNQHVSGNVTLDALIDENGRVATMKVTSGPTLLHQAAMDSLRQWKYQPATLNGKPVPMHLSVVLQFKLQ